jgi:ABC-type sugar transport system substrate-binding protein
MVPVYHSRKLFSGGRQMMKKSIVKVCFFLTVTFWVVSCTPKQNASSGEGAVRPVQDQGQAKPAAPAWADDYKGLSVKPDGKITVAHMLDSLTNESSQRALLQMQNEITWRGWNLIAETDVSNSYEADATRRAFERVLVQRPDAIVISYLDIPPIADLILRARQQGIGVYSHGTDFSPGMLLHVESAQAVMGAKIASYAIQRKSGIFNAVGFIDLWMPRGVRRDIVAAALFEKGGWDIGETVHHNLTAEGNIAEEFDVVTNWITKYGDELDFVWTCFDLGSITAAQAMAAKGYAKDQMFAVGIDGGAMAWAYIRAGEIPFVASLADCFEYQIHTTCEAIKSVHIDGKVPGNPDCVIPANNYITTDSMTVIIDENNVPAVGSNIHALFNYYGGNPDDPDAWYNQGRAYTVQDNRE